MIHISVFIIQMKMMKKIYCIPYAGGSAYIYKRLFKTDDMLEIVPIELAGRGSRSSEGFYMRFEEAVSDVYDNIVNDINNNIEYAIYGHSMGSLIAYEVYYKLKMQGEKLPNHIFLSGCRTPENMRKTKYSEMNDDEFIISISKLGGTPVEILQNTEFGNAFLPILKSDFSMIEGYSSRKYEDLITVPVTIFHGKDDFISQTEIQGWKALCNEVSIYLFDGNHFFINHQFKEITRIIKYKLYSSKGKMLEQFE